MLSSIISLFAGLHFGASTCILLILISGCEGMNFSQSDDESLHTILCISGSINDTEE
jgi:hypothetical protein